MASLLPEYFLDALAAEKLDLENVEAMSGWTQTEKNAIFTLFSRLSPSYQKRRLWIEYLNDLKLRDDIDIAQCLSQDLFSSLASPSQEQKGRDHLYKLRFPELSSYKTDRLERIKNLKFPPRARLDFKDNLEDNSASLNITFENPKELEKDLATLLEIVQSHNFYRMFNAPWKEDS
jgi:hypothetical protein